MVCYCATYRNNSLDVCFSWIHSADCYGSGLITNIIAPFSGPIRYVFASRGRSDIFFYSLLSSRYYYRKWDANRDFYSVFFRASFIDEIGNALMGFQLARCYFWFQLSMELAVSH